MSRAAESQDYSKYADPEVAAFVREILEVKAVGARLFHCLCGEFPREEWIRFGEELRWVAMSQLSEIEDCEFLRFPNAGMACLRLFRQHVKCAVPDSRSYLPLPDDQPPQMLAVTPRVAIADVHWVC